MSGDAHHITAGRDDGEGALLAMKGSFMNLSNYCSKYSLMQENEGIQNITAKQRNGAPFELWCINAHATSTPKGDAAEFKAVNRFVEELKKSKLSNVIHINPSHGVWVTSHKGIIGHLMGAAGVVESAFVGLALSTSKIPPTLNVEVVYEDMEIEGNTKIVRHEIGNLAKMDEWGPWGIRDFILLGCSFTFPQLSYFISRFCKT